MARTDQEQIGTETCLVCRNEFQWLGKLLKSAAAQRRCESILYSSEEAGCMFVDEVNLKLKIQ